MRRTTVLEYRVYAHHGDTCQRPHPEHCSSGHQAEDYVLSASFAYMLEALDYIELINKRGVRAQLRKPLFGSGNNIVAAGRRATKLVGKLGYHGAYIPQHAEYGWGNWFVVCNMGANATYEIEAAA